MESDNQIPPPPRNIDLSFREVMGDQADAAWALAIASIAAATGEHAVTVAEFLNGPIGSAFAETIYSFGLRKVSLAEAVDQATERWMNWRSPLIPRDMPSLTFLVKFTALYAAAPRA